MKHSRTIQAEMVDIIWMLSVGHRPPHEMLALIHRAKEVRRRQIVEDAAQEALQRILTGAKQEGADSCSSR